MLSESIKPWTPPTHGTRLLLKALALPRVGIATVRRFAAQVDARQLAAAHPRDVAAVAGISRPAEDDIDHAEQEVEKLLHRCEELAIEILSVADSDYPVRLREITDYPPVLFLKGDRRTLLHWPCVAVVGTRQASPLGLQWAHKIAKALALNGFTTVSGLALGIDAAAHQGALEGEGRTVAVMAHGLHMVAPASHKELAAQILQRGGALVSEHPPGVPPRPAEFVRRNRIQSGLSLASIVVESAREGGAMHQARFTREQGRALFAAMPEAEAIQKYQFNPEGSRFLMSDLQARPISSHDDLLLELKQLRALGETLAARDQKSQMTLFDGHSRDHFRS